MRDNWPDSREFWRNKRVVVTGGAGFLGSFVVEKLQERRAAEVFVPRSAERYNESEPVNLGSDERVTVADWVRTVIKVSGKRINVKYVSGPVGVHARNFSKQRSQLLGWKATTTLREGIEKTYRWLEEQVKRSNEER